MSDFVQPLPHRAARLEQRQSTRADMIVRDATSSIVKPIIYIAGMGRSGSTLIEGELAKQLKAIAVGELNAFVKFGFDENSLCTCNESCADCDFWSFIRECLKRETDEIGLLEAGRSIRPERPLYFPFYWLVNIAGVKEHDSERYLEMLRVVYNSIDKFDRGKVIIESSKSPFRLYWIKKIGRPNFIIHVVRDPRAVAFSWSNPKFNPARNKMMMTMGWMKASFHWNLRNAAMRFLPSIKPDFVVRYEDYVESPQSIMSNIMTAIDKKLGSSRLDPNQKDATDWHSISGNPERFKTDRVESVRADNRYLKKMPTYLKLCVTLMTLPICLMYKYPVRAR